MKSMKFMLITALTLFAALAAPVWLAAQEQGKEHTRYKLIDLGTFGGPNSTVTVFGDVPPVLNNQGTVVGCADTPTHDPNFPNFNGFLNPPAPDPFIFHTFQWQKGALTDLGALPGVNSSCAFWISGNGLIAGLAENSAIDPLIGWPEGRAAFWKDGEVTDLGTLGGNESFASAVNNRGQVIGTALNAIPDPNGFGTQFRAFLWQHGVMHDLGTLGGPDAQAFGINERGQVVGVSYLTPHPTGVPTSDPVLWEDGRIIYLGTFGGTFGVAGQVNNHGQVLGGSNLAGDQVTHGFLWDRGVLTDLGNFGGNIVEPFWLNELGEAVGTADYPGDTIRHAFLWKKGVMTDLGTLYPTCSSIVTGSVALGINSKTQIVGNSWCDNTAAAGFLWENGGPMVDLNTLIPSKSGMQLLGAQNINDRGEIAGLGVLPNGDQHAFLLIPCGRMNVGWADQGNDAEDGDCKDKHDDDEESASATATRRSNSTLTVAQRLALRRMMAGFRAGMWRRHPFPIVAAPKL